MARTQFLIKLKLIPVTRLETLVLTIGLSVSVGEFSTADESIVVICYQINSNCAWITVVYFTETTMYRTSRNRTEILGVHQ